MNQFLQHFREIQRGMRLRDVLTLEWMTAVQECLQALSGGENITLGGDLKRGTGDGRVHIGTARKKRIRRGGGVASKIAPLTITSTRPSYVPEPTVPLAEGKRRFYVTWGMANNTLPDNRNNCVDLSITAEANFYIAIKAFINPTKDNIVVTHCEWVTYTQAQKDAGTFDTPDYGADGARPAHVFYPLGAIAVNDAGVATIIHNGGGSIWIKEYIVAIAFEEVGVKYKKAFDIQRLSY